jgi:ergothioneine biosynthesis protein EgtB
MTDCIEDVLINQYKKVRQQTLNLCKPLEIEDYVVQPSADISPPKWHLAHTTWFFAQFLLSKYCADYCWPNVQYPRLFNSYYKTQGAHWPQPRRGALSRPTVKEVFEFRAQVDSRVVELLASFNDEIPSDIQATVQIGLEHEAQHQELLLMDIQFIYWSNPTLPVYHEKHVDLENTRYKKPINYKLFDEGLYTFGAGGEGFAFDNERPQHPHYLQAFKLAQRQSSNREYLEFVHDGGYSKPSLWLSEGWDFIQSQQIKTPLYWHQNAEEYFEFDLSGLSLLTLDAPVRHISYFEADAFARWAGKRLPTEFEWELGAEQCKQGQDVHGTLWEWTSSPYAAYPGYQQPEGAFGEYNGKFMYGQMVLRGGCLATPRWHYRSSYRNFYFPSKRWMFSGIRLAENA